MELTTEPGLPCFTRFYGLVQFPVDTYSPLLAQYYVYCKLEFSLLFRNAISTCMYLVLNYELSFSVLVLMQFLTARI